MATKRLNEVSAVSTLAENDYIPVANSSGALSRATVANVRKAVLNGHSLPELEDGVFVYAMPDSGDSYPRFVKPTAWLNNTSNARTGYTPIGIAVQSGEKMLVVSLTEAQLAWSSSNVNIGEALKANQKRQVASDWGGEAKTATAAANSACGANTAPGWCNALSRVSPGGNGLAAGQWWLPSMAELLMVYANLHKINYALSCVDGAQTMGISAHYWSSTEQSSSFAWFLSFSTGIMSVHAKTTSTDRVRAVSAVQ